jgi:hypothetical protein
MDTQRARKTGQSVQRALRAGLVQGTVACATSAAALVVCSKMESGRAAAALNGPSQWLWGEAEAYTRRATLRHTAVGGAIHEITSVMWATLHELVFGEPANKSAQRICAEAAVTAATGYVVDYHLTPRRFQPGFEKHLGPLSMFAVYSAFAAGLAAAALVRRNSRSAS